MSLELSAFSDTALLLALVVQGLVVSEGDRQGGLGWGCGWHLLLPL